MNGLGSQDSCNVGGVNFAICEAPYPSNVVSESKEIRRSERKSKANSNGANYTDGEIR